MRLLLATVATAALVPLAACGSDDVAVPDTAPPTTAPRSSDGTSPPTDPERITIDDIEIDPDAEPAGPLFGSSAAAELQDDTAQTEAVCTTQGACEGDVVEPVEPVDPFVPQPEHQAFCSLLAEMEQRPYPDDEFEQLVVAQAWFGELRVVTPEEIARPFDELIAVVDRIVATQDVDFEPAEGSDALAAIETIGDFIETSC